MQAAEAIEHGQRGIHLVAVVEGVYIGIGVCLGVDGTAEVVLPADTAEGRNAPTARTRSARRLSS